MSSTSLVKRIIHEIEEKSKQSEKGVDEEKSVKSPTMVMRHKLPLVEGEVDSVQTSANNARTAHEVSTEMLEQTKHEHEVLLREDTVHSALKEAADNGKQLENGEGSSWAMEGDACCDAVSTGTVDEETMFAKASKHSDNLAHVCSVNMYTRKGLDLVLSLSSPGGETLEIKVHREASVADVAGMVKAIVRPAVLGKAKEVKLVGLRGTLLPCARAIGDALDYESEEVPPDDQDSVFYPLSVLTGEKWKEMRLHGPTRWKHLREDEFKDLFGMSKNTFEKLQPWTQLSLKKKHGLF